MIVVLGRPSVHRPQPDGELLPAGLVADIAQAIARSGVAVEVAGSVGDDPEGDRVVVELGRAGIGHAAMLRDPSAHTPAPGAPASGAPPGVARPWPRLEAADVELALGYLAECRVLVVADTLDPDALAASLRAADYHGASVVIVAPAGSVDPEPLGDRVTLLEQPVWPAQDGPTDDEPSEAELMDGQLEPGPDGPEREPMDGSDSAFIGLVAEYAMRLDRGEPPASAFAAALGDSDWEPAAP